MKILKKHTTEWDRIWGEFYKTGIEYRQGNFVWISKEYTEKFFKPIILFCEQRIKNLESELEQATAREIKMAQEIQLLKQFVK